MCSEPHAHDEGTYRLYDNPKESHEHCLCSKRVTTRTCVHPDCKKRFTPRCGAAIFCSYDCFFKSGLEPYWDHFYATYGNNVEKLKQRLSKELYRHSDKGKASRQREYEKYNPKRRERRKKERENQSLPDQDQEVASAIFPPSRSRPKRCRRPGCLNLIKLPSHVEVKYFCSNQCKKAFRNIRKILKTAYRKTECPCVFLSLAFLISL